MAKRSQRHPVRHEKGLPGCMWGLISIFDFRQGRSTQKLLSDRNHGSSRHAVGARFSRGRHKLSGDFDEESSANDNGDENETLTVDIGKTSVKKLMEDEMSSEQQTKKQASGVPAKQPQYDSEHGEHCAKSQSQTKNTCKVAGNINAHDSNASESLKCQELYSSPNSLEQIPDLDLAALMEDFCSQIHQRKEMHLHHEYGGDYCGACTSTNSMKHSQLHDIDTQLVQKHCVLQEKLSEAAAAFLNQKFINATQISRDGALNQSKQLMDALDILNLNKELLFELLEDSNSLLVKHIEDLRDSQSEKVKPDKSLEGAYLSEEETAASRHVKELVCSKQVQKQNTRNFFRRRVKSESRSPSKGSGDIQGSNHIVILKPSSADIKNSVTATSSSSSPKSNNNGQGQGGRFNSQFSISEIKRKLKHAMRESRKERNWISMDGLLHKIPHEHQDSGNNGKGVAREMATRDLSSKAHICKERTIKPLANGKREDKLGRPTDCHQIMVNEVASTSADGCINMKSAGYSQHKESNIYIEARKHLAEMLSNGDEHGALSNREDPSSLGRILSLPEYNLPPVFSPGKDTEDSFIAAKMRLCAHKNLDMVCEKILQIQLDNNACHSSPLRQNLQILPDSTDCNKSEKNLKAKESDANSDTSEEFLPDSRFSKCVYPSDGDISLDGGVEIEEIHDAVCLKERNFLNGPSELNSTLITSSGSPKNKDEEEFPKCLRPDPPAEDEPTVTSLDSFSSNPSIIQKVGGWESINDGPERPSPVSVLEPLFLEDITSPTSSTSQSADLPIQPLRIQFESDSSTWVEPPSDQQSYRRHCVEDENPIFEYVTAVLQTSNVNWDEFLRKYQSSDHPLGPSLFDEVEILFSQPCGDRKLLFDCINEVLTEIHECYFGCSPFVAFVICGIHPLPEGKNIIHEVWEGLNWHLLPQCLPQTLEQIVGKDMEKSRTWLDLRLDTEAIGIEMTEVILEELMEDMVDLCS